MENKTTENLIEAALNSQKPDKKVLSAAKEVVGENKPRGIKHTLRFYISASCSVIMIIIGIIFVIPVTDNGTMLANVSDVFATSNGLIIGVSLIITGILLGAISIIFRIKNRKR